MRDVDPQGSATFLEAGNLAAESVVFLELAEKDFLDDDNNTHGKKTMGNLESVIRLMFGEDPDNSFKPP